MLLIRGRRLPVIAVALASAAFLIPGVADAAPIDQIQLEASDALVATGSTSTGIAVTLANSGDADVALTNVKVVIDASGLAGVATVAAAHPDSGGDCNTAGTRTTCTYATLKVSIINAYPAFLDLKAVSGAAAGTSGTYAVTAVADGLSRNSTGTVTLAEGINLVAGPEIRLAGGPGSTVALSPTVRNVGSRVVHGVVMSSSSGSKSASYQAQYRNCVYTDVEFYCVFDQDLAVGKQYTPASPVSIRLSRDAPAPSTFDTYADFETPEDVADYAAAIRRRGGKPGTGPTLSLVEMPASALRTIPQTDVSAVDNFSHVVVDVTGKNLPDLTALDTIVRGEAGTTVAAKIQIKNLGPAIIDSWDQFPSAYVVIPAGTTVVKADHNCVAVEGKVGEYRCLTFGLTVGQSAAWTMQLKIGATGTGTITARTEVAGDGTFGPDANATNNAAKLLINPPAGAGGGDNGGEGGGLPLTGTNVTLAVGIGVALLLAGGIAVVIARRRIRFIA